MRRAEVLFFGRKLSLRDLDEDLAVAAHGWHARDYSSRFSNGFDSWVLRCIIGDIADER